VTEAATSASLGALRRAWWTGDRVLVVLGLVVAVVGLCVAIWQLHRTRQAAEAAERASQATRRTLRTSDLRRAIDTSLEIARRIDVSRVRSVLVIHLGDWLAAYQRIHALIRVARDVPNPATDDFVERMEDARGEVLVAMPWTRPQPGAPTLGACCAAHSQITARPPRRSC
jgi:FAD/FMN-containing dehydrogenase